MNVRMSLLELDPRTKLILLVLVNIIAFTFQKAWVEPIVIFLLASLLLACGCHRAALKWLLCFGVLVAFQFFLLPILPKFLAVIMTILTVFARKIIPCLMVGTMILQTTPVRHFILALRKWKVPQTVIIPLAVTLRYFPAIGEEHRHIRDAMKLKPVKGLGRKLRCTMLPLLVSAIQTSDELSAAAITRGIENPCVKTSVVDLRLHLQDWICLAAAALFALYTVFLG